VRDLLVSFVENLLELQACVLNLLELLSHSFQAVLAAKVLGHVADNLETTTELARWFFQHQSLNRLRGGAVRLTLSFLCLHRFWCAGAG
jgi:hypothetical protein